jgi:hypothetical protein
VACLAIEERDLRTRWELAWGAYQTAALSRRSSKRGLPNFSQLDPYTKARPKQAAKALFDHMVSHGNAKLTVKHA